MKADVKARWVAALRSGEYQKGKGYLKFEKEDGRIEYCCLGVLCDLSPFESKKIGEGHEAYYEWGSCQMSYLIPEIQEWAGLDGDYAVNPRVPWREATATLADINDNTEANFGDIADLIERHL